MHFIPTKLEGAHIIDIDKREDDRGFFARTFCQNEFQEHGLNPSVAQCNMSFTRHCGSIRGMHYQTGDAAEAKLIRCVKGSIHDVIVDLRPNSSTYLQHVGVELSASNYRSLYVPEGFAHGFQTLTDDVEVAYQVSSFYTPGQEQGLRHDDPALGIQWPLSVTTISEKDASWPLLEGVTA